MKITVTLSDAEVKGITEYLKEVDGIKRVTKKHIVQEIRGMVNAELQAPQSAVSDYIAKYENHE